MLQLLHCKLCLDITLSHFEQIKLIDGERLLCSWGFLLASVILRILLQQQHLLEKININLSHTEQNFSPLE